MDQAKTSLKDLLLDLTLRLFCLLLRPRLRNYASVTDATHSKVVMPVRAFSTFVNRHCLFSLGVAATKRTRRMVAASIPQVISFFVWSTPGFPRDRNGECLSLA